MNWDLELTRLEEVIAVLQGTIKWQRDLIGKQAFGITHLESKIALLMEAEAQRADEPPLEAAPQFVVNAEHIGRTIADAQKFWSYPGETASDKPPPPSTDVDKVIDQLDRRIVGDRDRGRLRGALDKADKPLGGKEGRDQAVGRAIRGANAWRPL